MLRNVLRFFLFLACAVALVACGSPVGGRTSSASGSGGDESPNNTGGFNPDDGADDNVAGTDQVGETDADPTAVDTDKDSTTDEPAPSEPVFDGIVGFPSEELFLQIVGPDAKQHVSSGGGITYLAGILFGTADKIVWQSSTGESGEAEGGRFWKTGPIPLTPGDNSLTIKAISDKGESQDTVTITYNPGFHFADRPITRPSGFFTGQAVDVVVSIGIRTKNILPSSVALWEGDEVGNTVGKIGTMVDNGDTTNPNCDEIQDDQVYSQCAKLQSDLPTTKYLRVSLQVQVEGALYTVFSPIVPIEIVQPLSAGACQELHQVQKDAMALYQAEVSAGKGDPGAAVIAMLGNHPSVVAAGGDPTGAGIWAEFSGGVLGALSVSSPGTRGGGDADGGYGTQTGALVGNVVPIESKRVLAFAPANSELGPLDEVPQIAAQLSAQECPDFEVDGPHQNGAATLSRLRKAYEYGILLFSGHADAYFRTMDKTRKMEHGWEHDGSQEILWTGDVVDCSKLQSDMVKCSGPTDCSGYAECVITQASGASTSGLCIDKTQIDLRRGRLVMGASTWGVHPEFFTKHADRKWPSSLVYLGACRTLFNGTLAGAIFGAGAKSIAGFTDYVRSAFASEQAKEWFTGMLVEQDPSGVATLFPVVDPENQNGHFALFGGTNTLITESDILNSGFEKGDTTGWGIEGDGRVVSQLGISIPVGGKFMGILSTGLGYTQQTGELKQSFCIPEGVEEVSFYWKFFSEEFNEWCGSIYQDTFQATLESSLGKISMVDVTVDDLCESGTSDCFSCGSQYVGLIPSDVSFDQGGVYNTQWQSVTADVGALAGKGPVTLRLFTTDAGDSIYDTVILVDSIQFD